MVATAEDREYLEINRNLLLRLDSMACFITCDPPSAMNNGHLPGLLPAVNGLDKPNEVKKLFRPTIMGKALILLQNGIQHG